MIEGKGNRSGDPAQPEARTNEAEAGRREALRKIGRFGAYTAPALLTLLAGTRGAAAS
jgi:hypothetical protein